MSALPAVVLIIEASGVLQEVLREGEKASYRILEAEDLREASATGSALKPDLLVGDLRAASGEGLRLYRRVEADPALRAVPVLLVAPPKACGEKQAESEAGPPLPESVEPQTLRHLVGHCLAVEGALSEEGASKCPAGAPLLEEAKLVVEARLGNPDFAVEELADAVDLSRRQLTRRMKAALGTTPAAFIRARRLERAKRLLARGPETIAQVAGAVGFASPSAFSKAFREAVGQAPSTYAGPPAG